MRDEENPFHYAILPIFDPDNPTTPSAETQQDALDDIAQQLVTYMTLAAKNPDPWKSIRIIVNCEKILDSYTSEGFDMLATFQRELQGDLWKVWRMARRQFIKRALLSPADEFPLYLDDMRDPKLHLNGPDGLADFEAVGRHLHEGQSLFDDLHKRDGAKLS